MAIESNGTELLINGNFATGDLTGWLVDDTANFSVMPDADNGNICVLLPQPTGAPGLDPDGLVQENFSLAPGDYWISYWFRASDLAGQPTDASTLLSGGFWYWQGNRPMGKTLAYLTTREWQKTTSSVTIPADSHTPRFSLSNFHDVKYAKDLAQRMGVKLEEGPIAVRNVSIWRM